MKTILKLLIPLLLISAVAGTPLSSAMLKYDKCPIPEGVENPKDLSNYINTLSYDYDKAELVNSGVNTYQTKTNYPYKTIANKRGICGDFALLNYVVLKELGSSFAGNSLFMLSIHFFADHKHRGIPIIAPINVQLIPIPNKKKPP